MKSNLISTIGIIICSFIGSALAAPTQLTLVKEVVGGEATVTDWVLTADGTDANDLSGAGFISGLVAPDTFHLSESTGPTGYTAGDWDCTGGGILDGQSLTLSAGNVVTCTIINTFVPPVVVFNADFALPSMLIGDGAGTPVCVDDTSGLLVAGCDGAVGPKGDVGPQGVQGDVGPQGVQGDAGPQISGQTGIQEVNFSGSITSSTCTEIVSITIDNTSTFDVSLTAHVVVEANVLSGSPRYEFLIKKGSTSGSTVGKGWWRPTNGFQASTVSFTGYESDVEGPEDYVLCARQIDSDAPDASIGPRGLNALWFAK
jgi:hypothetical protein